MSAKNHWNETYDIKIWANYSPIKFLRLQLTELQIKLLKLLFFFFLLFMGIYTQVYFISEINYFDLY